jgi:ABC-type spermidine/putrescine transport system permease subunit I
VTVDLGTGRAVSDDSPGGQVRPRGAPARWARHLLAVPSIAWTALFFLAPLYTGIFQKLYLDPVLRSFALSASATLACLLIGFPVAYTIARARGRRQGLLLLLVMIPFWTSFVVRTYGIYNVIADNGPLYSLLHGLGLVHGYIHLLFTPVGIGIGIVYTYLPLMVLPLYVALERIDTTLLEAASDLGAKPVNVLRRVILPLAVPGIIAGCILVAIPATGEYVIPQILGGGTTLMFGNVVSDQFLSLGNYPFGAALAVALTVILMFVLTFLRSRSYKAEAAVA